MELFIVKYHNFMHQSHWEARSLGALGWSATIPLKWSTALGWSTTLSCWTTLSWSKTVTRNLRRQRSWDSGQNLAHLFRANIKSHICHCKANKFPTKETYTRLPLFISLSYNMTSSLAIYSHHHLVFLHCQRCRFHRLWGSSWSCCRSPPPPSSPPVVGIGLRIFGHIADVDGHLAGQGEGGGGCCWRGWCGAGKASNLLGSFQTQNKN